MSDETRSWRRPINCGAHAGPIWLAGWLFTLGFLKLTFWKGVLGLILWPYYLGIFFRK